MKLSVDYILAGSRYFLRMLFFGLVGVEAIATSKLSAQDAPHEIRLNPSAHFSLDSNTQSEPSSSPFILDAQRAREKELREHMPKGAEPTLFEAKYCGAYVVWHWLRATDDSLPLNEIVDVLKIGSKNGCSIADITSFLHQHQKYAKAVRASPSYFVSQRLPFIALLAPQKPETIGHFVLFLPQDKDWILLDGTEEPETIRSEKLSASKTWDGTAILLQAPYEVGGVLLTSARWVVISMFLVIIAFSYLKRTLKTRTSAHT